MAKSLVIVESPSKAKTINKYLGNNFIVESSVGHIIDLPKARIGIDIENGFKPQFVTIKGKKEVIEKLQKHAKNAESVYIATDPDREGEAIAWHIKNTIKDINKNIYRVEFNEVTKKAVLAALKKPRQVDMGRVHSQQARRILDRIVGYKVSPFLWKSIYRGLSAGRVQSVALRLISERQQEIDAFESVEYWLIKGIFKTEKGDEFFCKLEKINDKKADIPNEEEAQKHTELIRNLSLFISAVKKRSLKRQPSAPFITSTLQQDAVRKLRMSSKRVMATAQALYEGVSIGKFGQVGLITYMRTDSVRISNEAIDAVRGFIEKEYGSKNVPSKIRVFKSKKSAQDAHEAIRPTHIESTFSPDFIKEYLSNDQYRLYKLIWKRFIACQMLPAEIEKTTIEISDRDKIYLFKLTGEAILKKGFLEVYDSFSSKEDEKIIIPSGLTAKEKLHTEKIESQQHFTKPPAYFNESTIIKELDELGIGRPSTYAQIISTLLARKYVNSIEQKLIVSELGQMVSKILVASFPDLINVKFTASMEDKLDDIEHQKSGYENVLKSFYTPFIKTLEEANAQAKEIKKSLQEKTDEVCEKCGNSMLVKWSRNGKFLACSAYPDCKSTKALAEDGKIIEAPKVSEHFCEKDNGRMLIKYGIYGQYLACENYPDCKNTKPMPTGVACPKCESGEIYPRRSKRGRTFFGCSNYPKCDFISWNNIENKECPTCKNNYMMKKFSKKKGEYLFCSECKHEIIGLAEKDGE